MKTFVFACTSILSGILVPTAQADPILDTGVPNSSFNRAVLVDPVAAQVLAQEFSLTETTFVRSIEAYIGGLAGNSIQMDLTTSIGPGASSSDILGTFSLATPGLALNSGAFVSATVDLSLDPGTYYLVFSPDAGGGFLPSDAPNTIGNRFTATDMTPPITNVNVGQPIASNFSLSNFQFQPGIRINGPVVPEPSALAIWSVVGLIGVAFARRRRIRAAA